MASFMLIPLKNATSVASYPRALNQHLLDEQDPRTAEFSCKKWCFYQWIGLRENLQESPIFNGKIYGFL